MTRFATFSLTLILTCGVALVARAQAPGDAERALRLAVETEMIRGDIEAALADYRRLAGSEDRSVAARALLRIARRQFVEGDTSAALETYERVRRAFADQTEAAAEATARLNELDAEQSGAQHRLVWDDAIDVWGGVSLDGRWLSFVDWETGDLGLRDLTSGQNRRLTDYGGFDNGEVEANIISPDGRRIAFTYDRWDERAEQEAFFELRIIDADGSNPRTLLQSLDYAYLEPHAWSPDGSRIAMHVRRRAGSGPPPRATQPGGDVVTISPDGEDVRVVASHDDLVPWRIRYSPDGAWLSYELTASTGRPNSPEVHGVAVVRSDGSQPPIVLVEDARNMGWTADGTQILFTLERGGKQELHAQAFENGQLRGVPVALKAASDIGEPMGMTSDGRLFYGTTRRTADAVLGDFDARTGTLSSVSTLRPVAGQLGVRGLGLPQFSPDGRQLAMVTGPSTIVIRDVSSRAEQLVLPAVPDIRSIRWAPDGRALFVSGRDTEPGIFRVDLETTATTLEFRVQTPAFALSPDGQTIYYRRQGERAISARSRQTGETRAVAEWNRGVVFDIVPSADGTLLAVSGANRLVFVDLRTGQVQVRWEYTGSGNQRLREGAWTPDGASFVAHFLADDTREIWTIPVGDGPPARFPVTDRYMGVSLSPDGRQLATMRAQTIMQLWVLEHFLPDVR